MLERCGSRQAAVPARNTRSLRWSILRRTSTLSRTPASTFRTPLPVGAGHLGHGVAVEEAVAVTHWMWRSRVRRCPTGKSQGSRGMPGCPHTARKVRFRTSCLTCRSSPPSGTASRAWGSSRARPRPRGGRVQGKGLHLGQDARSIMSSSPLEATITANIGMDGSSRGGR